MWPASPQRRMAAWAALSLLGALVSEALVLFVLDTPRLDLFQPLVVVIALAVALAAATISGARAALVAGTLSGLYATSVLLRYSDDPDVLVRLVTGLVVGGTIFGLSLYVGAARSAQERSNARVLAGERETARALEAHNRELAAANSVLRDFAHVVAHDLKEPIRGIDVLLDVLEEDEAERLSPAGRELLMRARSAERRLADLVNALLDYARATRIEPGDLRRIDVTETLASELCRARFANLMRERNASVEAPPAGAPRVLATHGALSLILGNLISNAIRHNPNPSPHVRVRVDPERDGRVTLAVEDNGPGFPPEVLQRLDEMAQGGGQPSGLGRSGFGLLLVTRAVERMGGRVRVRRSELGGAEVRVDLPAVEPPAPDAQEPAAGAPDARPATTRAPRRPDARDPRRGYVAPGGA